MGPEHPPPTDAASSGEPAAPQPPDLGALFEAHASGLAGAVRGVLGPGADVQEVLQEAFLRACRAAARGERARDPVAWIFVIALNLAKDQRRRQGRRGPHLSIEEVGEMHLETRAERPEARMERAEMLALTRAAIHALGDDQKEVFLLRVSGGLSFEAIADSLGIPVGTAKTRMRGALARVRASLARELDGWEGTAAVQGEGR